MKLKEGILTGNQLKILAVILMTIDHIGAYLLPQYRTLRIIGRLSMPIFAYMIAEGARYTKNKKAYLLKMAVGAVICQVVYFFAKGSINQCILVTFSLSLTVIFAYDNAEKNRGMPDYCILALSVLTVNFITVMLPTMIKGFSIDYDFFGVILPLLIYIGKSKKSKLLFMTAGLILLSASLGGLQWFCLLSIPLIMLYSGKRGQAGLKNFFYIYYPAHLAAIHLVSLIL